jgi:hypothetical protein
VENLDVIGSQPSRNSSMLSPGGHRREDIQEDSVSDLGRWIGDDQVRIAVALHATELGPTLVTHAALTPRSGKPWECRPQLKTGP